MKSKLFFILFFFVFKNLFCQDNTSVHFVWQTDDINTFDSMGYEGEHVMIQTELILIDRINNEDTTYRKINSLGNYEISIFVKEKRVNYINKANERFTIFHFKNNYTYEITYNVSGYYPKKIVLDTYNSGNHKFGYLFPCEVRLYKINNRNKEYIQNCIPLIKYDPESDFYQFTLVDE